MNEAARILVAGVAIILAGLSVSALLGYLYFRLTKRVPKLFKLKTPIIGKLLKALGDPGTATMALFVVAIISMGIAKSYQLDKWDVAEEAGWTFYLDGSQIDSREVSSDRIDYFIDFNDETKVVTLTTRR